MALLDLGSVTFSDNLPSCETENKIQKIKIKQKDNGYVVSVGCKTFVFEDRKRMLKLIDTYMKNPQKTEDLFNDGKLFK